MKETFTVGWVKILHQLTPMSFAYGHLVQITSRTPYWCPKTWNSGYVGVPVGVEPVNGSLIYVSLWLLILFIRSPSTICFL